MRTHLVHSALALGAVLTAAGTDAATPASPMLTKAKQLIAAEMVDPSSIQYRKLRVVRATVQNERLSIACGEYNAKNSMGGYTGFAIFAYEPSMLQGVVSYKAGGGIDTFGNSMNVRSNEALETKARILAVCMGVPQ